MGEQGSSQPFPADAATKIKQLWGAKKMDELRLYLANLVQIYPNDATAVSAGVMYDYLFLGKLELALARCRRLQAAVETSPNAYSDRFRLALQFMVMGIELDIDARKSVRESDAQSEARADPLVTRDTWGDDFHPNIDLVEFAPRMELSP